MAIFEGKNGEWKTTKNGTHFFVPDGMTDEEALDSWYESDLEDTGFGYKHKGIEYATDSEIDEKDDEEFNKKVDDDIKKELSKIRSKNKLKAISKKLSDSEINEIINNNTEDYIDNVFHYYLNNQNQYGIEYECINYLRRKK